MEVCDVQRIARTARARGVVTVLDNTWSAGLGFRPFAHDVDVSVQALTKYHSGGSDVMMGATITTDRDLHLKLNAVRVGMGIGVSSDDCSLILRSLPSLNVRVEHHGRTALGIAKWLRSRAEISKVLHPAFSDCPGHAFYERDFTQAGGLFSVIFDTAYSALQIDAFCESLDLFALGWSWGGAHSLVVPVRREVA